MAPGAMLAVVSPHLDDAVLGCGALLAAHPGAAVITVMAGRPPPRHGVTLWDAACGFGPDDDVVAVRRAEDRDALSLLGANPVWLDLTDAQYGHSPSPAEVRDQLGRALEGLAAPMVLLPLGLYHSDHALVSEAALDLIPAFPAAIFFAYEEAIYRRMEGLVDEALARLRRRGIAAAAAAFPVTPLHLERKRRALHCYRSQLRGLTASGRVGYEDAFSPERYYNLSRLAAAEET
jgi:LmbE family N-acetylglucosaminyl deacetylase